jgi:hypothetical protein
VEGHLIEKPLEAAAVRLAYELRIQGYGYHRIAKRLLSAAAPMAMKNGDLRPQKWCSNRVHRLIIKETYRGTIVDDETWLRAQHLPGEIRRPTMRYEYALGGAMRCECGVVLLGCKGTGKKSSTFRYYQCPNYQVHGKMKHHRSNLLEEQFIALLARLSADDSLLRRYVAMKETTSEEDIAGAQLTAARGEHARLEERRRAVFGAFEDGTLKRDDLQWRLDDLRQRGIDLEAQMQKLEAELRADRAAKVRIEDVRAIIAAAKTNWPIAEIDDRRALAKALSNALGGLTVTMDGVLHVGLRKGAINAPS